MKIFLIIIGFLSPLCQAVETVHIASGDWPPYLSESLERKGLVSAIVTEAFALEGIRVEYHFLPWKRNFESTKFGEYDGSLLWAIVPGREAFFIFSDTIIKSSSVYFHRKALKHRLVVTKSLIDLSVGVLAGWEFPNTQGFGVVEVVTHTEQNVKKLLRGRVNVIIDDRAVGLYMLDKHLSVRQLSKFTFTKSEERSALYYLMLSRKRHDRTDMMARFNHGLALLKASGAFEGLCKTLEDGKYYESCGLTRKVTSNSE